MSTSESRSKWRRSCIHLPRTSAAGAGANEGPPNLPPESLIRTGYGRHSGNIDLPRLGLSTRRNPRTNNRGAFGKATRHPGRRSPAKWPVKPSRMALRPIGGVDGKDTPVGSSCPGGHGACSGRRALSNIPPSYLHTVCRGPIGRSSSFILDCQPGGGPGPGPTLVERLKQNGFGALMHALVADETALRWADRGERSEPHPAVSERPNRRRDRFVPELAAPDLLELCTDRQAPWVHGIGDLVAGAGVAVMIASGELTLGSHLDDLSDHLRPDPWRYAARLGGGLRADEWSRHSDLNRGPAVYETAALPLSYVGQSARIADARRQELFAIAKAISTSCPRPGHNARTADNCYPGSGG
jgi:hypothetical protein